MAIFSYGSSLGDLDSISYIRPTDILRQMGGKKMEKELKNRYSATRNTLEYKSFGGGGEGGMGRGVKIVCRTVQFSPESFQRPLSPCYSIYAGELHHLNLCREIALGEYYWNSGLIMNLPVLRKNHNSLKWKGLSC